jgi:signal transduction histidine kinase
MIAILDLGSLIMRSAYFFLATFLLAYLSEQAKGLRAGGEVINRLTSKVNVREGLVTSAQGVLGDLLRHVGSSEAAVAFEELSSGRLVLWEATAADFRSAELHPDRRMQYFFALPKEVGAWQITRRGERLEYLAVKEDGNRVRNIRLGFPATFRDGNWTTVVGIAFSVGQDWRGRLFLVNPTARPTGVRRLRFLQGIVVHLTPVLQNVYLLRRIRLRVGALERARVARELHDSVLQSLTSIEMQLDVARRDATLAPRPAAELAHIQNLLRQEILNIRDLMEHLRPRVTDARNLVERLADLADRLRRETGIQVRCRANIGEAELEPELCHEVTRIVQEALTNIRKHSGATWAYVNFEVDDWAWKLTVTDNGCGYGFVGTLTHAELAARRIGPRTIRERVEAVGGKLQVHSGTNGLRLEMIGRLKKPWILTSSA